MTKQVSNQITQSQSPLDREPYFSEIKGLIGEGETNSYIATIITGGLKLPTTEKSIRRFRKRHGLFVNNKAANAGYKISGDEGEITSFANRTNPMDDPDAMLRERGLDPEEWLIVDSFLNEWDGPSAEEGIVTYHQLKLHLKKKKPELQILAARSDGWKAPKKNISSSRKSGNHLTVLLSDQHAPYHDQDLHRAVLQWLEENKPERGILLGDILDFSDISRHRFDPAWCATTQECVDSAYQLALDYVQASPDTEWELCEGNHEARLRNMLIDYVRDLHGLRPGITEGEIPGHEAYGLINLLRLDELGIRYRGGRGTYEHTKIQINKYLGAVHGDKATKGAGTSVSKTLEQYGHSIIQGHSHRQAIMHKTTYDIDGHPTVLLGSEIGCLCQLEGGLGYTINSDWQQGFGVVTTWSDGRFHMDLATYVRGALYHRGQRYQ
jgi:predicted phosphodiesterase